jgi:hypothetical protein
MDGAADERGALDGEAAFFLYLADEDVARRMQQPCVVAEDTARRASLAKN